MQPITIGTIGPIDAIRQRLDDEFRFLEEEGIAVSVDQKCVGKFTFLDCAARDPGGARPAEEAGALFRHYVANALSDVIVEKWEKELLRKIIRGNYHYFSRDEQDMIMQQAGCILERPEGSERPQVYRVGRKGRILHQIRDYLDCASELVVEGFVTFRLKEYVEELEDAVDKAVDDFLVEREYREFIRLLRYFVDAQEPRVQAVHVLLAPGGTFRLTDEVGQALRTDCLEEFIAESLESEVNYEDLLISALVTLAPLRVMIHGTRAGQRDESIETIKGVFGERAAICPGCPRCPGLL